MNESQYLDSVYLRRPVVTQAATLDEAASIVLIETGLLLWSVEVSGLSPELRAAKTAFSIAPGKLMDILRQIAERYHMQITVDADHHCLRFVPDPALSHPYPPPSSLS